MPGEIPTHYPSNERAQTPGNLEGKRGISQVKQFNLTLQRLRAHDAENPTIALLKEQFEQGGKLGKQAEAFYQAALAELGKDFGYTRSNAHQSHSTISIHTLITLCSFLTGK